MTELYTHQRPLQVFEPFAVDLHWRHSILEEPSFLAPWSAIDQATDLAAELGEPCQIVVTNFVLPAKRETSKRSRCVRFDERVQVFQGKSSFQKFHTDWTCLIDRDQAYIPEAVPCLAFGKQQTTRATGSSTPSLSSSPQTSHLLDRRLPDDLPGYVHHLQQRWRDDHIRLPAGDLYSLRTWYLHHEHQRIWKVPRLLQLPDDPRLWHESLLRTWRDQLHNDEILNVAVVFPRVRSQPASAVIHADVILTQGAHDQCGGVVTVYPPGCEDDMHYIWAASYPRHVSGRQLLDGVEAEELAQTHACDLFHGGIVIPVTTVPTHIMANGHSFVAVFQDLRGSALPSSSSHATTSDPVVTAPDLVPAVLRGDGENGEESPALTSSSFDEEDLQGVQVFGLRQPTHHCFVRWRTYNVLLFDILHSLGLHRDLAIGHHYLQAQLVDQHDAEEAIILQRVGDVPDGSSDRLVLIDIKHTDRAGHRMSSVRHVRLLPQQLVRDDVFAILRLQNPCAQSPDDCQLFCNNILWVTRDFSPRVLQHGAYLRIEVKREGPVACAQQQDSLPAKKRRTSAGSAFPDHDGAFLFQLGNPAGDIEPSSSHDPVIVSGSRSCTSAVSNCMGHSSMQPVTCSAMFSSLTATFQSGSNTPSRRRPPQAHDRHWMVPVRMAFVEHCATLADGEPGELLVNTWYLHHERYPRTIESRLLSLDLHHGLWYQDLCDLRVDVMDPLQQAQVHFVRFGPIPDAERPTPIHLLLVQGWSPLMPTLLTALFEHEIQRRVWHVAALVSEFIAPIDVWDLLGTTRFCTLRQCRLHVGSQQLLPHEILQVQSGDHIRITIMPQQPVIEFEDTSMMQQAQHVDIDLGHAPPRLHVLPQGSPDDSQWISGLEDSFFDSAVTEVEEEGPVLYVWTCFVHHLSFPVCDQPRIVRLGRHDSDWLALLQDPWKDLLQRDDPTQIRIVHARPPHDLLRIDTVHVLIEQLPADPVIAGVISVIFHEGEADRLLQRALSLPRWLCTEDLVAIMELNPICDVQRCSARVGHVPLEQFIRHDLPSAASIEIHVQPVRCPGDPQAASSAQLFVPRPILPTSGRSLMQISRRWQRARRMHTADTEPGPRDHLADEYHQVHQRVAACASPTPQQLPIVAPMWPTTWTTLQDVWNFFFAQLPQPAEQRICAAVWYSDHLRRPWSDDFRIVTLDDQLDDWRTCFVEAWLDWFLADCPFEVHVVHPVPLGANEEAQFHVVLLQQPHPLHKSVIVTVMDVDTDPWQPGQICVMVPNAIDHWALLHIAVVEFQCPPVMLTNQCTSSHGLVDLTAGNLFPVRHGMCFTVAVETTTTTTLTLAEKHDRLELLASCAGINLLQLNVRLQAVRYSTEALQQQQADLVDALGRAGTLFGLSAISASTHVRDRGDVISSSPISHNLLPFGQQIPLSCHDDLCDTEHRDEVVVAHANDPSSGASTCQHSAFPAHPLHLADLLQPPTWTFVDCSSVDGLRRRLYEFRAPEVKCDLDGVKCTCSTQAALCDMPLWTFEIPLTFEFYTDGAFKRSREIAAAGVVLIVYTDAGPRFGGYLTAWCLSSASAPRAEAAAMVLAIHWACHLVLQLGFANTQIAFLFDNVYAGAAAQGRCASSLNHDLAPLVRSLSLWLEQLSFVNLAWHHVKGHPDHPWNDLADAVAYGALAHDCVTTDISSVVQCCLGDDSSALPWLWLYEKSLRGDADAPVLHGSQWRFNTGAPLAHPPDGHVQPFALRAIDKAAHREVPESCCLRVASANVLTLFPQHDTASSFLGARAEHLADQFRAARVHCVGVQETRYRKSGHDFFEGFHVLSASASSRGHGGVQLWIAQTISMSSVSLCIDHEHLRVIYGDDRRLLVQLRHPRLSVLLMVLHAPCCDDEAEFQRWWSATSALIPCRYRSWTWIVLCDSNGRLGSVTSRAVGDFGAEPETLRGAVFHDWLVTHGLIAPQTHAESHVGSHTTWTHAEGSKGRLDFICLSDNILLDNVCTWVSDDIDLSIARPDHQCICADVWIQLTQTASTTGSAAPAVEDDHLFSWACDVHTHAAQLQWHLKQCMHSTPKRRLRKKHLSDATYELILHKKRALRTLHMPRLAPALLGFKFVFAVGDLVLHMTKMLLPAHFTAILLQP